MKMKIDINNNNKIIRKNISFMLFSFLTRDVFFIFTLEELYKLINKSLHEQTIIKLKMGIDPTGKSLHLGHVSILMRIKEFLLYLPNTHFDCILGDITILSNSPERKKNIFSEKEIYDNITSLKKQILFLFKDVIEKITIHCNSTWFKDINIINFLPLLKCFNVVDILKKFKVQNIDLASAIYPALQTYDSVVLKTHIEFGGSDQLCSVLVAREYTKQIAFLVNLLPSCSQDKMSKSHSNSAIFITESKKIMLKKIMNLTDELFLLFIKVLIPNISFNNLNDLYQNKKNIAIKIVEQFNINTEENFSIIKEDIIMKTLNKPYTLINLLSMLLKKSKKHLILNFPKVMIDDKIIKNINFLIQNKCIIKMKMYIIYIDFK